MREITPHHREPVKKTHIQAPGSFTWRAAKRQLWRVIDLFAGPTMASIFKCINRSIEPNMAVSATEIVHVHCTVTRQIPNETNENKPIRRAITVK